MNQVEIKRRQIQLCAIGLWLLVIWILGKQLGDNGVAYLTAAMELFLSLWAVAGAGVADALGRLLRGRNARGQYKNADKLQESVLMFQGLVGLAGGIVLFCFSRVMSENVLRLPYSRVMIMLMAPVFLLRTISSVLLGCFQGEGSELPAVVSSILQPLLFLGFGFLFCGIFSDYGEKVSGLLGEASFTAMYGGVGVSIAMLLSEALMLLFLLLISKGSSRKRRNKENEGMRTTDSFPGQVAAFCGSRGAAALTGGLLFLPMLLGIIFFQKSSADNYLSTDSYGLYVGKYLVLCGILIALFSAAVLPLSIRTAGMLRKDEYRNARFVFQSGIKMVMVYTLFPAVVFTVMPSQLAGLLSNSMVAELTQMFTAGSGIIVFGTLAYYAYGVLKLCGKKYWSITCITLADVVYVIMLAVSFQQKKGDIMVLVQGGMTYSALLALLLCLSVCLLMRIGLDWLRIFVIPTGCVSAAGLVCFFMGKALTPHLGGAVALLVSSVISGLLYFALIVFMHCFGEQELTGIPGCRLLSGIRKLLYKF